LSDANNLRHSIKIDRLDPQTRLQFTAQRLAPGLGTENAAAHRKLAYVDAHRIGNFRDVERIGWRREQTLGTKILQQRNLTFRASAGDRHHGAAEPFRAIMGAEPAGK
jgi:hypothetical protein